MSGVNLDAIEAELARYDKAIGPGGEKAWSAGHLVQHVRPLLAEVRRLQAELAAATPQILTTEPGPEVTAVWDRDGDKWTRHPAGGWRRAPFGDQTTWEFMGIWEPITATPGMVVGPAPAELSAAVDALPGRPEHGPDALPHGYVPGGCGDDCNNGQCPAGDQMHDRCTEACVAGR
ncbi:hypothetical protein AWW66_03490 [Micromonospora rosaria]|uniref:Uncharacterized protein n=1 Tax=Micromonospora rosaria TaxID=47874 RepID=A0A136PY33_9ACTN|nr:hypothetical protein [Micromonospora rosaria]KXK63390.1 hypothetical protein AWW66_03490 [Micromonospora rosaria]